MGFFAEYLLFIFNITTCWWEREMKMWQQIRIGPTFHLFIFWLSRAFPKSSLFAQSKRVERNHRALLRTNIDTIFKIQNNQQREAEFKLMS